MAGASAAYLVPDRGVGLAVVAVDGAHGGRHRLRLPPEAGAPAAEPRRGLPAREARGGGSPATTTRLLTAQPRRGHAHHLLYPRAHPASPPFHHQIETARATLRSGGRLDDRPPRWAGIEREIGSANQAGFARLCVDFSAGGWGGGGIGARI
jgi:hypothetical protein